MSSLWRTATSSAGASEAASSTLSEDAAGEIIARIGAHHIVEGVAARGGVEQQQAAHVAGAGEHRGLLGHHAVALAHAHGVDQHHVLVAQAGQGLAQVGVAHRIHRHAEDAAVDAQLFLGADAVAVGG